MVRSHPLLLLPDEPAGRIATRSAGAALFEADFSHLPGDLPGDLPISVASEHALFRLAPPPGARFLPGPTLAVDGPSPVGRFCLEVRFLTDAAGRDAADILLREASVWAAVKEAVLEARLLRLADPVVHPATLIQSLARDLRDAGIGVGFGPSWSPVAEACLAVGSGGACPTMARFAREQPRWHEALSPGGGQTAGNDRHDVVRAIG